MPENINIIHDQTSPEEYLNLLQKLRVPAIVSKEEAWNILNFSINRKINKTHTRLLVCRTLSLAAGIAIIIGLFHLTGDHELEKKCLPGQMMTLNLPDSSKVTLNAASSIHYQEKNWNKHRLVHLEGEAFFKVKKGSKFEVLTSCGKIVVLGTSFNVYARDNQLKVYCKTGKVAVSSGKTILLTPGMKTQVINGNPLPVENVIDEHESSWLGGEFWYKNAPIAEVVAEIERQYNVVIQYQTPINRFYTGYFNHKSLDKTLVGVFGPMQLNYSVTQSHNEKNH